MDATEALTKLLSTSLSHKRERYVDFASRPKAQKKLLNDLYHKLIDCFDPKHIVSQLPASAWSTPAYGYAPPRTFGVRWSSLKDAILDRGSDDAYLLVTEDGLYGVYCQEDCFGGPIFIRA